MKKLQVFLVVLFLLTSCSIKPMYDNTELSQQKDITTFDIKDRYGETFNLANYKGKRIIIKFWGTWCPICSSTLDQLDSFTQQAKDHDLIFITVTIAGSNQELSEDAFLSYLDEHQINETYVAFDTHQQYWDEFNIQGVPSMVLINENFEVIYNVGGSISFSEVLNLFEE